MDRIDFIYESPHIIEAHQAIGQHPAVFHD